MFVDAMASVVCLPNVLTYNDLIEALCKIGAFDEVERVLGESGMKGWELDEISYSIYMDGLCKFHTVYKAFMHRLGVEMTEEKVVRNLVTYSFMINCLCQDGKLLGVMERFHRSHTNGFSSHLVAPLVDRLVRNGKKTDTLNFIVPSREWGQTIIFCIFSSLSRAYRGIGYCQSKEMLEMREPPDILIPEAHYSYVYEDYDLTEVILVELHEGHFATVGIDQ